MGCLFSKTGQVRRLSEDVEEPLPASAFSTRGAAPAWLQEIGLPQYGVAFEDAGFSDWDLLSCLTEGDLEAITAHTGTIIPPGHRKKLLMASRQMGQPSQHALAVALAFGSARRYSHSSNPGGGNGSRAGGLAAAAALALERRSYGRRPSGPSRASSHVGMPGQNTNHHHHQYHNQSRNVTEDGLVSGRRGRPVAMVVPSRTSSRTSLSGAGVGHAIGYIASPSVTVPDGAAANAVGERHFPRSVASAAGVGDGDSVAELCPSTDEPGSPRSPAAAAMTGAALGGQNPQRRRRRWSVSKGAARGGLVSANGNVVSGSSMGWMDGEAVSAAGGGSGGAGGGGPTPDDVRQISMTSSLSPVRQCSSRDLDSLVIGVGGAALGAPQAFRNQSLAAARPDRPFTSGMLPSSPPQRGSCGQFGGSIVTAAAAAGLLGEMAYIRGSMRHASGAMAQSQSQPHLDSRELQHQQPRTASARDGDVNAPIPAPIPAPISAAVNSSGSTSRGVSAPAGASRRPGSAADTTLSSWAPVVPTAAAVRSVAPHPGAAATSAPAAIGSAAAPISSSPMAPGLAWGSQVDATILRGHDADAAHSAAGGGSRVAGGQGGALPRFVRAIAGWAIPAAGGGPAAAAAAGDNTSARRDRPEGRYRRSADKRQRESTPQPDRSRRFSGVQAAGARDAADRSAAVLTVPRVAVSPEPSTQAELRGARSARSLMVPDTATARGPWDQDSALCIQGRGYKLPLPAAALPSAAQYSGDDDSEATASAAATRPVSAATAAAAGACTSAPVSSSIAAAAAAARGGGWPFVMPQLPQPIRMSHTELLGLGAAPPGLAAGTTATRAMAGQGHASRTASPSTLSPLPEVPNAGGGLSGPSTLLEVLTRDASNAAASRPPPVQSSRPRDSKPSGDGTSTATVPYNDSGDAANADVNRMFAAELALYASPNTQLRPAQPRGGTGAAAAAAAAHWPAMPLHPPTRAKPMALVAAAQGGGGGPVALGAGAKAGAAGDHLALMELLAPEPPGPSRGAAATPGAAAAAVATAAAAAAVAAAAAARPLSGADKPSGGAPIPTPWRQLDLEMLADQLGRIMAHMANITTEEDAEWVVAGGAAAKAAGGSNGSSHHGGGVDAVAGGTTPERTAAADGGGGGGAGSLRPGARMQAIERKRLELRQLHRDLVGRVAALAAEQPQPRAGSASSNTRAPVGPGPGGPGGEGPAADALSEVEAHIRAKLTELAALTIGPDSDLGDAAAAAAAAATSAGAPRSAAAAGSRPAEAAKGLALGPDAAGGAGRGKGHAGGGFVQGQRQADESALYEEVLAVLGARKRQVRAGRRRRSSSSDSGGEGRPGAGPTAAAAPGQEQGQKRPRSASSKPGSAGERGGVVLAEMHDFLRAELSAIDNKIKARVRAPGTVVARRA